MTGKEIKKKIKRVFRKNNIYKAVIVISTLALIATSVLPYVL
ncbi:MAG: hypothetical protein UU64_C0003G0057 [candidate division WWE3 bacterium GW2011_GWF2_41_45]|uniref:Uncharacterized protein n=1 Tax=candidate division WWE3 bacterium GW2011_GWC2_41_23 TaxID=1619123 RepID=A0A0G0VR50_UNCKA|nr:MAG: hypothetical protein UU55_C0003G0088 [candidate division WWE3 bacterium GW2011_GWC2_41_23]KKS10548.1 MAG: hypothetical protein UU64_C0003G0057 [candidate division WWE3 bacterium GW2011_GWF2_41_45]KKS20257.1 MAG: hypothetical protein UU79_C0002G0023 [candidate division WWE3 bacterium GW2011_GWE1_41_72]KKS28221.1 MAG: hypothetical protein UU90_C0033G0006 [candidate division WWE3 bacterium GW2011_GWD2_42_11]KKS28260.1 MAG: hypothetical protein UU86_C0006G0007 [candidate division WWE3 bacte